MPKSDRTTASSGNRIRRHPKTAASSGASPKRADEKPSASPESRRVIKESSSKNRDALMRLADR